MSKRPIYIHKFGGTSMGGATNISHVARLVEEGSHQGRQVVVVSAMKGITNLLADSCVLARDQEETYKKKLQEISSLHAHAIDALIQGEGRSELLSCVEENLSEIQELLRGVWLAKSLPETTFELVTGYGEVWAAKILVAHLKSIGQASEYLDAREFLTVKKGEIGPIVMWELSKEKLSKIKLDEEAIVVATGYIAVDQDGVRTTLGRNGSDYSASILGKLFNAGAVTIWTDVDGVYSADPRFVPEARLISHLSYQEAMELAYFGAKVLHPHTMGPTIEGNIELKIRNTFRPECAGTLISSCAKESHHPVKGFATVEDVALINVEGSSMVGVPGVAQKLFGALKDVGVSVILISQASSEHSICFAIPSKQVKQAEQAAREVFFSEIHHGRTHDIQVVSNCSILAAVGDNMAETPGVAAKFFSALGRSGVNIRAIAQGSSERNISVVIDSEETTKALRAVHAAFYLSNFTVSIGLIGPGVIGKTFIQQVYQEKEKIKRQLKIDFRIRGIANSRKMLLEMKELDLKNWEQSFQDKGIDVSLPKFVDHIYTENIPHAAVIDCTANESVSRHYESWLRKGIHIITPNKKASSSDSLNYKKLKRAVSETQSMYFNEATVGAGLPIISTIKDLVETGDEIFKVEGILSGTLSHIFNSFGKDMSFSEIVIDAKAKGFTEPDPRDDLSGVDVARKVVILARHAGFETDLSKIQVESLVPQEFVSDWSVEEFLSALPKIDLEMAKKFKEAEKSHSVLRYVGSIDSSGKAFVGIRSYPKNHAFARISGTDNIIAFTTKRYCKQPLIIQGPGAGPDVTAAGVFADLLRLANHLGAQVR